MRARRKRLMNDVRPMPVRLNQGRGCPQWARGSIMQANAPLDIIPIWAVFAGVLVAMLLCIETGHRGGRWRAARTDREKEGTVGGMVAPELGLLAFLLEITFSVAAAGFETRREVLLEEANGIGTAYLRAAMLRPNQRDEVRQLLRDYVDARLAA